MRKTVLKLMGLIGAAAMTAACTCSGPKNEKDTTMVFDATKLSEEPVLVIKTDMGDIKVKLYKETPKHRDNFLKLASEGYYDGLLFHRVINGFMIQTGDPLTKDPSQASMYGTGGPGYTVPAEFVPGLNHKKGALAAARKGDKANPMKESSGSQFYIVQDPETCAQLDGQYTVFGETIEGFDVIDRIASVQTGPRDMPLNSIHIISIRPEKSETDTTAVQDTATVKTE